MVIEREGWPGNEFGLWLPECALSWVNWRGEASIQNWEVDGTQAVWRYEQEDSRLETMMRVDHDNECIWYSHEFTNDSDRPLEEVTAQTCFHLVNAPEFISIRGERLWACMDGNWSTTDLVPRDKSLDPNRIKLMRCGTGRERRVEHVEGFPHSIMPQEACHPLFIAESMDGKKSVGVASRDMLFLFNNNDYILRCIHSEPVRIASIPPGGSATQEGAILFVDGDHEDLVGRYGEVVPDEWWSVTPG
ncbi:MAG: hypothetical protein HXS50_00540 [Theionarchaea archaeon]|nr:hypothetical protein [Theionarchaea archaeon]